MMIRFLSLARSITPASKINLAGGDEKPTSFPAIEHDAGLTGRREAFWSPQKEVKGLEHLILLIV